MRKPFPIFLLCLSLSGFNGICATPEKTPKQDIQANPLHARGTFNLYEAHEANFSDPPAGFTPCYLSHYGRHGGRVLGSTSDYISITRVLEAAREEGFLTELGENLHSHICDLYEAFVRHRLGDLTDFGWEQVKAIGARTAQLYPDIFFDGAKVYAISSEEMRCVLTMSAFSLGLQSVNPKLSVRANQSPNELDKVRPGSEDNPWYEPYEYYSYPGGATDEKYAKRRIPTSECLQIIGRLVSNQDWIKKNVDDLYEYCRALYKYCSSLSCFHPGEAVEDEIFTQAEWFDFWEAGNVQFCAIGVRNRDKNLPILRHLVEDADADLSDGGYDARLRFGHDTNMMSLLVWLGANGMDRTVSSNDKLASVWQNWNVPMGGTMELVFYRASTDAAAAKYKDNILVKLVLNGEDATLSSKIKPATGCFYRWSDVKAYVKGLKTIIEKKSK